MSSPEKMGAISSAMTNETSHLPEKFICENQSRGFGSVRGPAAFGGETQAKREGYLARVRLMRQTPDLSRHFAVVRGVAALPVVFQTRTSQISVRGTVCSSACVNRVSPRLEAR